MTAPVRKAARILGVALAVAAFALIALCVAWYAAGEIAEHACLAATLHMTGGCE